MKRVYMYTFHERMWHWVQAFVILGLLWTGIEIHAPDLVSVLGFKAAVIGHNALAAVLVINAGLGLLYHVFTGQLRQYLPEPQDFFTAGLKQARYYLSGIFRNEPHPFEKQPERKLNPLQKLTYFAILNFLLPMQVLSGLLLWGAQWWPEGATVIGGLNLLAPFHTLLAWFFGAFVLMHIYLATTGTTPLSNFLAMIVGWEELESTEHGSVQGE